MCRSSHCTTGIATTATMSAQTIGPVIVYVAASSQITSVSSCLTSHRFCLGPDVPAKYGDDW